MAVELTFVSALVLILVMAALGRLLSKGLRQPAVFGELLLGMVLGVIVSSGALVIAGSTPTSPIPTPLSDIASIGILLLLFSTGLGLNFEEFKKLEVASSIVAVSGVILPFVLGYFAAILFFNNHLVALFVGVALVATSIGVGASILSELRMLRTRIGTLIIGAAVIDDVIGIIMISVIIGVAAGIVAPMETFLLIFLAISFFIISLTVGIKVFKKLSEKLTLGRENLLMLGLIIVLVFGLVTQGIGLAAIIGAFVAGLVVGQSHYAKRLREHVSLIGGSFFIPIFFVTIGMSFNFNALTSASLFATVLVVVAIVGKVVGCGIGAKLAKCSGTESLAVGVAMIPRAGVEMVLLKLGLDHGIISSNPADPTFGITSAILVMVLITTLITPPSLWRALKIIKNKKEV